MPAELTTREELINYAKLAGVPGYTDAQYDEANAGALDAIRQAGLNDYTPASFEALTPTNAPAEMRDHARALALHILTKANAGRPPSIGTANERAEQWLKFLSGGSTHYDESPGAVLVKRSSGSGATVRLSLPTMRMNYDDPRSDASRRDPPL